MQLLLPWARPLLLSGLPPQHIAKALADYTASDSGLSSWKCSTL